MNDTLQAILDLTDRVQAAINDGEWQHARELETDRHGLLERLVAEASGLTEPGLNLQDALAQLQRRCQQMIGDVHHHRRRVLREASTVKAGHAAVGAYTQTGPQL